MHSILHYTTSSWVQLDWAFRTPIALLKTKTPWTNEKLIVGQKDRIHLDKIAHRLTIQSSGTVH